MLAYHRYVGSRTISKYLVMILFFGLGLMAKTMLVTLPFVLLLLDFWPLKREELNLANNSSRAEKIQPVSKQKSTRYPPIDCGKGSSPDYGPGGLWGNVLCTIDGRSGKTLWNE